MKPVTDPALLAQLEEKQVIDPALLAQLEGRQEEPSLMQQAGRAAGLTGRSLIEGALAVPSIVTGGLGGLYNVGASAYESMAGKEKGFRFQDPGQQLSRTLSQAGLPEPQGGLEQVANIGTQMLGGGLATPVQKLVTQTPKAIQTLKQIATEGAQRAGYVTPPSAREAGGPVTTALESFGGKAALKQQATLHNQQVTDELARAAAGLKPGEEISKGALAQAREIAAEPYRQVASLSQTAAKALENLKQTRYESGLQWASYNRTANPDAIKLAKALDSRGKVLERVIEREAVKSGQDQLVQALREARVAIAKSHDVERALNPETGEVSAKVLARIADKKRFTDELRTIASFGKAFPQYAGEATKTPTPGVSALNPLAAALYGGGGAALMGPMGAAAAGIPLLRGPARQLLLSRYPELAAALMKRPSGAVPGVAGLEALQP